MVNCWVKCRTVCYLCFLAQLIYSIQKFGLFPVPLLLLTLCVVDLSRHYRFMFPVQQLICIFCIFLENTREWILKNVVVYGIHPVTGYARKNVCFIE